MLPLNISLLIAELQRIFSLEESVVYLLNTCDFAAAIPALILQNYTIGSVTVMSASRTLISGCHYFSV